MASIYCNVLLLTIVILLCSSSQSSLSTNNDVENNTILTTENQTADESNNTSILVGLKTVLDKVKNKIYPKNANTKDEEISQNEIVNDDTISKKDIRHIQETYKTVDINLKVQHLRTSYNWFTVANDGWTHNLKQGNHRFIVRKAISMIEEQVTKDKKKLSKDTVTNSKNVKSLNFDTQSDNRLIPDDIIASNNISSNDSFISDTTNTRDELQNKTAVETPPSHSSNQTNETNNISPEHNLTSDETGLPIVLDTIASVGDMPSPDGTKTTDSGKIETYSQFAERLSAEKKNGGSELTPTVGVVKSTLKVTTKNYASKDCGAKLLSANPGAEFPGHVISRIKDEYMLNKCDFEAHFVIMELCESIRTRKFEVANFELFSSVPKDIRLYGSYRYPVRDWILIGEFQGEEGNRGVQSFVTYSDEFIKYVKLEVITHYGSEFYCPLSLFRIFGISEFEAIDHLEDDDFEQEVIVTTTETPKDSGWALSSPIGHVLSVIKRGSVSSSSHSEQDETNSFTVSCRSLHPHFAIQAEHCQVQEYLNYILSCYYDEYQLLLRHKAIAGTVKNKILCNLLYQSLCSTPTVPDEVIYRTLCKSSYACVMLSPKHIFALCYLNYPLLLPNATHCQVDNHLYIASGITTGNDSIEYKNTLALNDSREMPPTEGLSPNETHQPVDNLRSDQIQPELEQGEETSRVVGKMRDDKMTINDSVCQENPSTSNVNDEPIKNGGQNNSLGSPDGTVDPLPTSESKVVSHSSSNKESIVVRLSNKIKVLEENMSISSQYLEELSQTFKRQMKEMNRQFNITITALNKSSQIAFERDVFHHGSIESLEYRLQFLNQTVEMLIEENHGLVRQVFMVHCTFILFEIILFYVTFKLFWCQLKDKLNGSTCHCCCGRTITGKDTKAVNKQTNMEGIQRTGSDSLCSVNHNRFMDMPQKSIKLPQNGLRVPPSGLPESPDSSCLSAQSIDIGTRNDLTVNRVQNISSSTPTSIAKNVGLSNSVDAKQVIPCGVDHPTGLQFHCSDSDFKAPVINDYYASQSNVAESVLPLDSRYLKPSNVSSVAQSNYEGLQSYMDSCYHQSQPFVPSHTNFDQVGLSNMNSAVSNGIEQPNQASGFTIEDLNQRLKSYDPNSELSTSGLSQRMISQDSNSALRNPYLIGGMGWRDPGLSFTDQNLTTTMKSQDKKSGITIQNLDSRFSATGVKSGLKAPIYEIACQKQEVDLQVKSRESNKQVGILRKVSNFGSRKQETSKKNKKKKKINGLKLI